MATAYAYVPATNDGCNVILTDEMRAINDARGIFNSASTINVDLDTFIDDFENFMYGHESEAYWTAFSNEIDRLIDQHAA